MRIKLDVPLSLSEIAKAVDGTLTCGDAIIHHVCTDSREVSYGDLFIALSGNHSDGNSFAYEATAKGGYVLAARYASICVTNTRAAILKLVKEYKRRLTYLSHTVAITGSVGKTTTKELTSRILSSKFKVHANLGNFNNDLGLLHTVLSAGRETEVLIAEMGMNHIGEISRLSRALEPDIGLITNIGTAHVGNLGSRENIAKAKLEISDGMNNGVLIVPSGEALLESAKPRYEVSIGNNASDALFLISSTTDTQTVFSFTGRNLQLKNESVRLVGAHLLSSFAFALSVADLLGCRADEVLPALTTIDASCLRQRRIRLGKYDIFDDTYSSSPEAVIAVMKAMTQRSDKVSAALGDMLELGSRSNELHCKVGEAAARCGIRRLYLFGEFAERTAEGALAAGMPDGDIFVNRNSNDPQKTAEQIRASYDGELLLVKASHAVHAERIYDFLKD